MAASNLAISASINSSLLLTFSFASSWSTDINTGPTSLKIEVPLSSRSSSYWLRWCLWRIVWDRDVDSENCLLLLEVGTAERDVRQIQNETKRVNRNQTYERTSNQDLPLLPTYSH
jgi:hypothetical protein